VEFEIVAFRELESRGQLSEASEDGRERKNGEKLTKGHKLQFDRSKMLCCSVAQYSDCTYQ
jgi:hypothetical protein